MVGFCLKNSGRIKLKKIVLLILRQEKECSSQITGRSTVPQFRNYGETGTSEELWDRVLMKRYIIFHGSQLYWKYSFR